MLPGIWCLSGAAVSSLATLALAVLPSCKSAIQAACARGMGAIILCPGYMPADGNCSALAGQGESQLHSETVLQGAHLHGRVLHLL